MDELEGTIGLLADIASADEVPENEAMVYGCFLACHVMLGLPGPTTRIKNLPGTGRVGREG